ncbi:MAG: hypothetical protein KIT58_07095 [Planctomycetota bacterium]|nr:hypothetical protein [Planctomycetota bacterium]
MFTLPPAEQAIGAIRFSPPSTPSSPTGRSSSSYEVGGAKVIAGTITPSR